MGILQLLPAAVRWWLQLGTRRCHGSDRAPFCFIAPAALGWRTCEPRAHKTSSAAERLWCCFCSTLSATPSGISLGVVVEGVEPKRPWVRYKYHNKWMVSKGNILLKWMIWPHFRKPPCCHEWRIYTMISPIKNGDIHICVHLSGCVTRLQPWTMIRISIWTCPKPGHPKVNLCVQNI